MLTIPARRDKELIGTVTPAAPVTDDGPLPMSMAEGNRLAADWPQGTVLARRMIVPPRDSVLWELRAQQDTAFFDTKT